MGNIQYVVQESFVAEDPVSRQQVLQRMMQNYMKNAQEQFLQQDSSVWTESDLFDMV